MYIKILKEKEEMRKEQLKKIRSKIKLEELKQKQIATEFVLSLSKVNNNNQPSLNESRNTSQIPQNLNLKLRSKNHPLYSSILGSRRMAEKGKISVNQVLEINKSHSNPKTKEVKDTIKKIRQRLKSLIKQKRHGFDKNIKSVVNT